MKIKTLISFAICSLITNSAIFAQEAAFAVAKVHYIFKHVNDSTQPEKFLRDEVVTYLGATSSYYASYSATRAQEEIEKQMNDPAFDGNLVVTKNTSSIQQCYLYDAANSKLTEVVQVGSDNFLLPDTFPELDWTISEESKEIGGYACQKAEVSFKGRDYTAWFTTELPFSAGPWKLRGLPGLILEASDAKKEVQFEYSGFDKINAGVFPIAAPKNALASSRKEVAKLQEAFKANPQAYLEAKRKISTGFSSASTGTGSTSITISGGGASASTSAKAMDVGRIKSMNVKGAEGYTPSRVTNNPIELTP